MNTAIPDIVAVAVFIAALIFSPQVAAVVGPYVVIIGSAVVGASFAVARRERSTRLSALWYFSRVTGLAVAVTVAIATWAASYWAESGLTVRFLISPIAFVIGLIGDDLPELAAKVVRFFMGRFTKDTAP